MTSLTVYAFRCYQATGNTCILRNKLHRKVLTIVDNYKMYNMIHDKNKDVITSVINPITDNITLTMLNNSE